jgi:hypothetical protein
MHVAMIMHKRKQQTKSNMVFSWAAIEIKPVRDIKMRTTLQRSNGHEYDYSLIVKTANN